MRHDPMYQKFLQWRGIEVPCETCYGTGFVANLQEKTMCSECLGSGDKSRLFNPWIIDENIKFKQRNISLRHNLDKTKEFLKECKDKNKSLRIKFEKLEAKLKKEGE
jgi:excinuclease UvrABC ATPase subunit